ncbi:type I restriction endonuclease [Methanoplanus endosymbiosus]|uniref:type I site-specific deoxyribonuclease n=1 Tax=Methanoplanus endosymbiosus TaxID=33865 RepID=A0A9E7PMU4_9EURY|nr:type I restriction endonuclease [Methanoplanus endosymbiosus]UUX93143.1 type I restriction endonuclease [Methanoplanus endosymbiosus]
MTDIGALEIVTQKRVIRLFTEKLGYEYLGDWQDREDNKNIEEEYLRRYLESTDRYKSGKYDDEIINKALFELNRVSGDQSRHLYDVNKDVYTLLRYGVNVKGEAGENSKTVRLINWKKPENNHFAIAEEVTVTGNNTKRPDIVLYINGSDIN